MVRADTTLRLICYNMQVAIGSRRAHHMLSHGWRYLFPHGQSQSNLRHIAALVAGADFVGLNEADAGSARTRYLNQAEYIATLSGYDSCEQMITRNLGKIAQHSNSLLSRHVAINVVRHRLPKPNDGRGVLEAHYIIGGRRLVLLLTHLSLSRGVREAQLAYLADIVNQYESVILMGDMNCSLQSPEMARLFDCSSMYGIGHAVATFPSWKPRRALDHILVSKNMKLLDYQSLQEPLSDHLAVAATVSWK